ncbi:glycoside hydrolase family 36 protein [Jiangella endophytica]|uniref:glycoside hydrolase family 36 protein n=1 Tax=Jiangella endophytica TaxID=1623398 RepID=UPI0018E527E7|nr:glycoside hydrolase family 36 protein [Jiangella endophytica]
MGFEDVAQIPVDPARGQIYEHGWQSRSPTTSYPVNLTSARPVNDRRRRMRYRPETPAPSTGFQGEGLLVVDNGDRVQVISAADPTSAVPSIRAGLTGRSVTVSADGPVDVLTVGEPLGPALATWADGLVDRLGTAVPRPAPTVWSSWHHYSTKVREADIDENLVALARLELPVDVVQIDDGWQTEVGDWLGLSSRFTSLEAVADRIRGAGRDAGIWLAPFLAGSRSALAAGHPDWLIRTPDGSPVPAGRNWNQDLFGLDVTRPAVREHLRAVFGRLRHLGFSYFKIDVLYAGALPGVRHTGHGPIAAYRQGLELIRDTIGPDSYLVGCGAPILPSIGLVDAMRVSADTAPTYEPGDGDLGGPSQRGATISIVGRAWQHGRFWVNDSDCLIAHPAVERRTEWADVVTRYGGLRASSDRLADLDDWGLAATRRLLSDVPPPKPFA